MGDGEAEPLTRPSLAGTTEAASPARPRGAWTDNGRTVALLALGFAGGLAVSPALSWMRQTDTSGNGGGTGERYSFQGAAAVTSGERQQAAKLLLAASSLARAAEGAEATPTGSAEPRSAARLTIDGLPSPVRESLLRLAGGRPLRGLSLQERAHPDVQADDPRAFAMRFDLDAVEHDLLVDAQGKLLSARVDMAPSELPHSVQTGIDVALPQAVILRAEKHESSEQPPWFEVQVRAAGARRELKISESGEILRNKLR